MKIGLFIPCYVNAIYPEVGVASYKLLKHLGVDVEYPLDQTCCGQPMANGGFEKTALPLCERFERQFAQYEYIVAPSASCVAFVKENYPAILSPANQKCLSGQKIYEVCEFLHDVLKVDRPLGKFPHKVSLHNSCHGVRELKLSSASELHIAPFSKIKDLLALVEGIELVAPDKVDECCGFGGMFSVEEPGVSVAMGCDKVHNHLATGAAYITGADSSCLMHMKGIIDRQKLPIQTIHVVQILAMGL